MYSLKKNIMINGSSSLLSVVLQAIYLCLYIF